MLLDDADEPRSLVECSYRGVGDVLREHVGPARGLPADVSARLLEYLQAELEECFDDTGFDWLSLDELTRLSTLDEYVGWERSLDATTVSDAPGEGFQVYQAESMSVGEYLAPFLEPTIRALEEAEAPEARLVLEFG